MRSQFVRERREESVGPWAWRENEQVQGSPARFGSRQRAAGKGEESFESRLCLLGCKLCEPRDLLCHVTCCLERQVAQSRYAVSIYGMSV